MDEPLYAHTPNELLYYLRVTSCQQCGHGPLVPREPEPADGEGKVRPSPGREASVRTHCKRCGHQRTFHFRWEYDVPPEPENADCTNPSTRPSRIIDLGQWVVLYSLFSEAAEAAASPTETRRNARQAALCLAEALKFHGEEELPPESAFFCEASRAAFRANPANYARTRLRELQALLPAPAAQGEADEPHGQAASRPWWKFWER